MSENDDDVQGYAVSLREIQLPPMLILQENIARLKVKVAESTATFDALNAEIADLETQLKTQTDLLSQLIPRLGKLSAHQQELIELERELLRLTVDRLKHM